MREDVARYQKFLEEYAPYGYALLFARTGDFYTAQGALEEALVRSFADWRGRRIEGLSKSERKRMKSIAEGCPVDGHGATIPAPETSFSRSAKIQAIEQAREIVRSFPAKEQVALVLLYVQELPEERVREWVELDEKGVESLRGRVREKIAAWKPPAAEDETPVEFFGRSFRQYRLSSHFIPTVLNRIQVRTLNSASLLGAFRRLVLYGVPILLVLGWLINAWDRRVYWEGEGYTWLYVFQDWGGLVYGVFVVTAMLCLRRYLVAHAPPALSGGAAGRMAPVLKGMAYFGILFLCAEVLLMLSPSLVLRGGEGILKWYAFFLIAWRGGAMLCLVLTVYLVAVHYLRRLDRLPSREKEPEAR